MNKHKIMYGISVIVHIALLAVFLAIKSRLDVFTLIVFMVLPILLSCILAFIGTKLQEHSVNVKEIPTILFYVGINTLYWLFLNVQLNSGNTLNTIYEASRQYNSGLVEVSSDNSPVGTMVLLIIVSFILYYFTVRLAGKRSGREEI